jgi:hypothetical protein
VAGIGVINRVAAFGSSAQLITFYKITVIDGRTFEVIGKQSAAPIENDELFKLAGPNREIGSDLLAAAQNPGGSDRLKAAVFELIDRSLEKTLGELQLINRSAP